MTEDYTPTTDQVRQAWRLYRLDHDFFGKANYGRGTDALNAEFDRWLAEVKAEGWYEGYRNGYRDRGREASYEPGTNPYRGGA